MENIGGICDIFFVTIVPNGREERQTTLFARNSVYCRFQTGLATVRQCEQSMCQPIIQTHTFMLDLPTYTLRHTVLLWAVNYTQAVVTQS